MGLCLLGLGSVKVSCIGLLWGCKGCIVTLRCIEILEAELLGKAKHQHPAPCKDASLAADAVHPRSLQGSQLMQFIQGHAMQRVANSILSKQALCWTSLQAGCRHAGVLVAAAVRGDVLLLLSSPLTPLIR